MQGCSGARDCAICSGDVDTPTYGNRQVRKMRLCWLANRFLASHVCPAVALAPCWLVDRRTRVAPASSPLWIYMVGLTKLASLYTKFALEDLLLPFCRNVGIIGKPAHLEICLRCWSEPAEPVSVQWSIFNHTDHTKTVNTGKGNRERSCIYTGNVE